MLIESEKVKSVMEMNMTSDVRPYISTDDKILFWSQFSLLHGNILAKKMLKIEINNQTYSKVFPRWSRNIANLSK